MRAQRKAGALGRALSAAANVIWPPQSLLSERFVDRPGAIEPERWAGLEFLCEPLCARCGFPLPAFVGEGAVCGACAADPPAFDRARAALAYTDEARTLVLSLKRAGRRDGLPVFAAWMALAAAPLIADADLIAPVPIHWRRLAQRSFNQAAWLAQALSRHTGKAWRPDALVRRKLRRSQEGLSASERARNVQGAFIADRRRVEGRSILLVDDVFTTGATVSACARALRRAKAARVDVVTLARVVRPVDATI